MKRIAGFLILVALAYAWLEPLACHADWPLAQRQQSE